MSTRDVLIGLIVGVVATFIYQAVTSSADITYECTSNTSKYSCRFFNRGSGSGAMCVTVTLKRDKPSEAFVKQTLSYNAVNGNRLCSGPLNRGEDKIVNGEGFFTEEGKGTSAEDLCRTKEDKTSVAGCAVVINVVAITR